MQDLIRSATRVARNGTAILLVVTAMSTMAVGQVTKSQSKPRKTVPEIDMGSMSSGLTLMGLGVLMLTGRSRRK